MWTGLDRWRRVASAWIPTVAAGLPFLYVLSDLPPRFLVVEEPETRTDAALVFGGDPRFERTEHAADLYARGLVSMLIVSGGEPGPGDSAASLARHAMASGVPAERIVLEERATSTRESALFVRTILEREQLTSLTLVTSPYHQRRAFWTTARVLGDRVRLVNSPAQPSFFHVAGWWKDRDSARVVASEYAKLAYYAVRGWI